MFEPMKAMTRIGIVPVVKKIIVQKRAAHQGVHVDSYTHTRKHTSHANAVSYTHLDEQRLAVTGSGYVADGAARGNVLVEIGHDDLGRTQDVAVVVTVPGRCV